MMLQCSGRQVVACATRQKWHRSGPLVVFPSRSAAFRVNAAPSKGSKGLAARQSKQAKPFGRQGKRQAEEEQLSLAEAGAKLVAEIVASPLFYLVAGLVAIKLVASTGEQAAPILIFAALPITLLTVLSKSELGKRVQENLEERLPELESEARALRSAQEAARLTNPWYGEERPRLPGPLGAAPHLTGEVAGDYGFDPLGLSVEREKFDRYYEVELLHARWAMLGALGCVIPEALTTFNGTQLGEPVWWKVGAAKLNSDLTFNWGGIEGFRIAGKQGIGIIAACQVVLMGGPEYARYVGIKSLEPVGVFLPGTPNYPGGGPFDPLGLANDPQGFADQSVREIKNGRLAMFAMLGFFVQALVTREGPVQNLVQFLEDPAMNNITKYL